MIERWALYAIYPPRRVFFRNGPPPPPTEREQRLKESSSSWLLVIWRVMTKYNKYNTSKMVKNGAISGWKNWIGAKNTITDGVAPQCTQKL